VHIKQWFTYPDHAFEYRPGQLVRSQLPTEKINLMTPGEIQGFLLPGDKLKSGGKF